MWGCSVGFWRASRGMGQQHERFTAQLVQQHLGLFQIGGVEALGEPVVDRINLGGNASLVITLAHACRAKGAGSGIPRISRTDAENKVESGRAGSRIPAPDEVARERGAAGMTEQTEPPGLSF